MIHNNAKGGRIVNRKHETDQQRDIREAMRRGPIDIEALDTNEGDARRRYDPMQQPNDPWDVEAE